VTKRPESRPEMKSTCIFIYFVLLVRNLIAADGEWSAFTPIRDGQQAGIQYSQKANNYIRGDPTALNVFWKLKNTYDKTVEAKITFTLENGKTEQCDVRLSPGEEKKHLGWWTTSKIVSAAARISSGGGAFALNRNPLGDQEKTFTGSPKWSEWKQLDVYGQKIPVDSRVAPAVIGIGSVIEFRNGQDKELTLELRIRGGRLQSVTVPSGQTLRINTSEPGITQSDIQLAKIAFSR
jgi:hypothetical protein